MEPLSDELRYQYTLLLEQAIIVLRMRIRYADSVTMAEVHDYLDSLHNVGAMLRGAGSWKIPENIDADLQRYDDKWLGSEDGATSRQGLFALLQRIRDGEFDGDASA